MKKVLILGADGFIGSNLTRSLLKRGGYSIRAFDLFKNGISRNLGDVKGDVELFSGNFLNREDTSRALEEIDLVFHLVSLTTPGASMDDPLMDIETNIKGTVSLLENCVQHKVGKLVFISSGGAIYGNQEKEFYSEEDLALPISPYAISKLAIERYLAYFQQHRKLDYLVIRLSNPFGPRQDIYGNQGVIPIFANLIQQEKPITIFGDGTTIRDYIYIDDAVKNLLRLVESNTKYNLFNVGSGVGLTLNEIISLLEHHIGKRAIITRKPKRDIDVDRVVLDISRAKSQIDYALETNINAGIEKTISWINSISKE